MMGLLTTLLVEQLTCLGEGGGVRGVLLCRGEGVLCRLLEGCYGVGTYTR